MDYLGLLVFKRFYFLITHIRILILVAVFIVFCLVKINNAKPTQVKIFLHLLNYPVPLNFFSFSKETEKMSFSIPKIVVNQ